MLFPNCGPLPQISQTCAMTTPDRIQWLIAKTQILPDFRQVCTRPAQRLFCDTKVRWPRIRSRSKFTSPLERASLSSGKTVTLRTTRSHICATAVRVPYAMKNVQRHIGSRVSRLRPRQMNYGCTKLLLGHFLPKGSASTQLSSTGMTATSLGFTPGNG